MVRVPLKALSQVSKPDLPHSTVQAAPAEQLVVLMEALEFQAQALMEAQPPATDQSQALVQSLALARLMELDQDPAQVPTAQALELMAQAPVPTEPAQAATARLVQALQAQLAPEDTLQAAVPLEAQPVMELASAVLQEHRVPGMCPALALQA